MYPLKVSKIGNFNPPLVFFPLNWMERYKMTKLPSGFFGEITFYPLEVSTDFHFLPPKFKK
jgi:hypothetical protein